MTRDVTAATPDAVTVTTGRASARRPAHVVLAAAVAGVGVLVLVGWAVGSVRLTAVVPGMITMKVNTAAGLICLSVALAGINRREARWRRAVRAGLAVVAALAVGTLAEYLAGVDLRIDNAVFRDVTSAKFPGRNAPATNAAFLGLVVALGLMHLRRAATVAQALLLVVAAAPLASLGGYLYRAPGMYQHAPYPVIALNTAVALMLLCVGGLAARPGEAVVGVVTSTTLAGKLARTLLPVAVGVPLAAGLLVLAGQRAGWYTAAFGAALLDACCAAFFAVAVCWAATVLLRTERRAGEGAERLRIAVETAGLASWDMDLATGAITCAEAGRRTLGFAVDDRLTYARWAAAVHPDDRAAVTAAVDRSLADRADYHAEYRVVWPDGAVRWVLASGRGVVAADAPAAADGRPSRMVGVLLDVTDRKAAEAERERLLANERAARAEADRANRAKDEFLSALSHELRTPLNAILGWAQILRLSDDPEELAEGLDVIDRNAKAQVRLVEDLLDMSRAISGKLRLDVRPTDLAAVLAAAADAVRPAADAKGVRMTVAAAPPAATVRGDAARLQQVFWNLLTNAVKFTPAGGSVGVAVAPAATDVEVAVTDTGEGIGADFLPFVFDRFRQADGSHTRRHGGLGLGLAIVKQLVELHGGSVRAASPGPGGGTTFVVALPLHATDPEATDPDATTPDPPAAPPAAPAGRPLSGVRVLVVDDEPDARDLARRLLERRGAVVRLAGSADEAIGLLAADRPDVLVSDIGMPGRSGYDLLAEARTLAPGLPAVAVTAYAGPDARARAVAAGFAAHVAKPADPADLAAAIAAAVRRPSAPA